MTQAQGIAGPGTPSIRISSIRLAGGTEITLPGGGVTAVVGGNNTGKSTLLAHLNVRLSNGRNFGNSMQGSYQILEDLTIEIGSSPEDVWQWVQATSTYQRSTQEKPMVEGFYKPNMGPITLELIKQSWDSFKEGNFANFAPIFTHYTGAGGSAGFSFSAGHRERPGDPPGHPIHSLEDFDELRQRVDHLFYDIFGQRLTLDRLGTQTRIRIGEPPEGLENLKYYDDQLPFREQLDKLSTLSGQGDGMRSIMGVLLPIVTSTYPIIILDEPEAFLHPPQAVKLGRILGDLARENGVQIIVATHDRNVIVGLLQSSAQLSVARLVRSEGQTHAHQLDDDAIAKMWSDPVLRYSNVLDGLFHSLVVVAENERDCTFYAAALDAANDHANLTLPPSEVLFVPTGGKDGMAPVVRALSEIKVPVVASPDLDILDNGTKLRSLVESLGGTWAEFEEDYRICAAEMNRPRDSLLVVDVIDAVGKMLAEVIKEDPYRKWDTEMKRKFRALTRGGETLWDRLKEQGVRALPRNVETRALSLIDRLDSIGLVVVRVGVLESFAIGHGVEERKGLGWLRAALEAGVHRDPHATEHVRRLLSVHTA